MTIAEKVSQAASKLGVAAQAKASKMKLNSLMRRLGRAGYTGQGEQSGPKQIVRQVNEVLSQLEQVEQEVRRPSTPGGAPWLMPRLALYGSCGTLLLVLVVIARSWVGQPHQTNGRSGAASGSVAAAPVQPVASAPASVKPYSTEDGSSATLKDMSRNPRQDSGINGKGSSGRGVVVVPEPRDAGRGGVANPEAASRSLSG